MNNANTLTLASLALAIMQANDRHNAKAGLPSGKVQPDLQRALKHCSVESVAYAATLCDDQQATLDAVAKTLPVKAIMRMTEFFSALHSGNTALLDRETALTVVGVVCNGAVSRTALAFCSTGKGDENTSDAVKGMTLQRKMQRALGTVGGSTEQTQHSRTWGKAGFLSLGLNAGNMQAGGVGERELVNVNAKNGFIVALLALLEKTSETTLAVNMGKKVKGAK